MPASMVAICYLLTSTPGDEHNWRPYLYSRYIQDRTRDYVMWHELGFESTPQPAMSLTAAK